MIQLQDNPPSTGRVDYKKGITLISSSLPTLVRADKVQCCIKWTRLLGQDRGDVDVNPEGIEMLIY